MKHRLIALAAMAFLAACGEAPTEPTPILDVAPSFNHIPGHYSAESMYIDFSGSTLDARLEDPAGAFTVSGGSIHKNGFEGQSVRRYVRTKASDFNTVDFVAEVTFSISNYNGGFTIVYFGLGSGDPSTCYDTESDGVLFRAHTNAPGSGGQTDAAVRNNATCPANFLGLQKIVNGEYLQNRTHRARLTKSGSQVTLQLDIDNNGSWDGTTRTFTMPGFLTASNSRIYFGTSNPNDTFDDLRIKVIDTTPPIISASVSGPQNGDWYIGDATLVWTVTDDESEVTTAGCDPVTVSADTGPTGVDFLCTAASEGGGATMIVTIQKDASLPVVTAVLHTPDGANGWYVGDVSVSWTVDEPHSPVSYNCPATLVDTDVLGLVVGCSATSAPGTTDASVTINRDASPPLISLEGNAGSYSVDQSVSIACSASDATSGISSSDCTGPVASGEAYQFVIGANPVTASATNGAGLSSTASGAFTVSVDSGSLCSLVQRWVSNKGVANSMCQQLKNGAYGAFINHVGAQGGKKFLAADKAVILIDLAGHL